MHGSKPNHERPNEKNQRSTKLSRQRLRTALEAAESHEARFHIRQALQQELALEESHESAQEDV